MDETDSLNKSGSTLLRTITESASRPRLLVALLVTPLFVFLSASILHEWRWLRPCNATQDELYNQKSKSIAGICPLDQIPRGLTSVIDSILDPAKRIVEFTALKFIPNNFSAVAGEDGRVDAAWAGIGTNRAFLV